MTQHVVAERSVLEDAAPSGFDLAQEWPSVRPMHDMMHGRAELVLKRKIALSPPQEMWSQGRGGGVRHPRSDHRVAGTVGARLHNRIAS
jgi:hypothetical protein